MRKTLPALAVLLTLTLLPSLAHAKDAFAGTWKVTITPDDASKSGEKEIKDTFTFKGNQFKSKTFDARGYKESEYEEDTRAGLVATFKSTSKSEKEGGTATWSGISTGQDLTGEMTLTKKDGTELKYTFKGTKAP